MEWFVSFLEAEIPLRAQACVLLALTWGVADGELVTVAGFDELERDRGAAPGSILAGLEQLQSLGWIELEPYVCGVRFRLTQPRNI